ncbi:hypothetical protein EBU58_01785 [bacterium]|nr:hypothetical protein [bacterium]
MKLLQKFLTIFFLLVLSNAIYAHGNLADVVASGNRGHARRIDAGTYEPACDAVAEMTVDETTEPVVVQVRGTLLIGELTVGHDRAWRRP